MLGELKDKNYYCCGFSTDICGHFPNCPEKCRERHRKHPTPEQFKEEYGLEYPDDGAVYTIFPGMSDWIAASLGYSKHEGSKHTICACAPFGKPDRDWRPE